MTSSFQPSISQAEFEACIAALWVFPIKSCAGMSVSHAELTPTGLAFDRAWMVVDVDGEMVTQRDLPRMALVHPDLVGNPVTELVLHANGMDALHLPVVPLHASDEKAIRVRVWDDVVPAFDMGPLASAWLTEFLGGNLGPLRLVRFDTAHSRQASPTWTQGVSAFNQFSDGFPVLVASTASLDELNTRLQTKGEAPVDMRRFRPNVVLGQVDGPHDEDRIGTLTLHSEGEVVQLKPVKPCPRCPIPNIDPDTANTHPAVSEVLQTYRQDSRVNGALTFGMNCIPLRGVGQVLCVGQRVSADWAF